MQGRHIINPVITDYTDVLYRPLSPDLEKLRAEAEEENLPVILKDTERALAVLLRMRKPARVLEIGTLVGYSACCFAALCGPDTEIVTLERDPEMVRRAQRNIEALGYRAQVHIVEGDARETIAGLDGPFEVVFIDAGKSHYREYWDAVLPLCADGAVIVCDNVLMRGAVVSEDYDSVPRRHRTSIRRMRAFLEYITGTEDAETAVLTAGDGLAVSVVRRGGSGSS
ncbi:MAG: O-methyltransferase [Firmicutes bacterium]|nr:O-methyltransferase [Bacillota bacterium]